MQLEKDLNTKMGDFENIEATKENNKFSEDSQKSTVQVFQMALLEKIQKYGDGIGTKALWEAIDPNLKVKVSKKNKNAAKSKSGDRITYDAFRKAVERLAVIKPGNEKMSFGIHGNIVLMMNVFEILGIQTIKDLLKDSFEKTDIEALIIESNIYSKRNYKRTNALIDKIILSMQNKPRIPNNKICLDWELILSSLFNILNPLVNTETSSRTTIIWDSNFLIQDFINRYDYDIKIAVYTYRLLSQYKGYFSHDLNMHKFLDNFGELFTTKYSSNTLLIKISPLYLLYFFLQFHKRFINIFIYENRRKINSNYTPFRYATKVKDKKDMSEDDKEFSNDITLTIFIRDKTIDMQRSVYNIIELFKGDKNTTPVLQKADLIQQAKDIIVFYIHLYSRNVDYDNSNFDEFMKHIKNINDLISQLTLGKPVIYMVSKEHIDSIRVFHRNLELLYKSLLRE